MNIIDFFHTVVQFYNICKLFVVLWQKLITSKITWCLFRFNLKLTLNKGIVFVSFSHFLAVHWHKNMTFFFKKNFGGHKSFCGATDFPVFNFWWCLLSDSKPEWEALFAFSRGVRDIHSLRFTSGATPAELLATSMASRVVLFHVTANMMFYFLQLSCNESCPKKYDMYCLENLLMNLSVAAFVFAMNL